METDMTAHEELCTWTDFSLSDVEIFLECSQSRESLRLSLCEKLGLDGQSKQDIIELDLYMYAFLFGKNQKFNTAQLSTLLSIVKKIHSKCISTPFENQSELFDYFGKLLVQHSVNRPPFSTGLFTPLQVKTLSEYVLSTYFKHYKLYKYAFTKRVQMNVFFSYSGEGIIPPVVSQDGEVGTIVTTEQEEGENSDESGGKTDNCSEQPEEPAKVRLKELITTSLNQIVKQEQEYIKEQLAAQETRLLGRISALESAVETSKRIVSAKKKGGKATY